MIVNVKVVEGERTRVQAYEGVCIGRSGHGLNENFTVRKISYGEGVERVFPLSSPMIDSIKLVRRGKVRRAKLYYLRGLRGKSARIAEGTHHGGQTTDVDRGGEVDHRQRRRNRPALGLAFLLSGHALGWLYLGHVESFQCTAGSFCGDHVRLPGRFFGRLTAFDPRRALSSTLCCDSRRTAAHSNLFEG